MDSSYGPLSKSDEKLRAEKNNTGDPPAAGLLGRGRMFTRSPAPTVLKQFLGAGYYMLL